jgi:hypothetical protein
MRTNGRGSGWVGYLVGAAHLRCGEEAWDCAADASSWEQREPGRQAGDIKGGGRPWGVAGWRRPRCPAWRRTGTEARVGREGAGDQWAAPPGMVVGGGGEGVGFGFGVV